MQVIKLLLLLCFIITISFIFWFYINQSQPILNSTEIIKLSTDELNQLLHEAEVDMAHRRRRIELVCTKYNLGIYRNVINKGSEYLDPKRPRYKVFIIDKLTYCPIYKAASSTWRYQFLKLAGFNDFNNETMSKLSRLTRLHYPIQDSQAVEQSLQKTTKFLTVRHPFERIISAYREKLQNKNERPYFYKKYGKRIVSKYRNNSLTEEENKEPTFSEFVNHLITDTYFFYDDHWMPYFLFCTPCLIHYDIIIKFETIYRDQLYLIHALQLQGKLTPKWIHITKGHHTTFDLVTHFYSQLTLKQIQKLYEKFKLDFELFDYKPDEYYKLAKK